MRNNILLDPAARARRVASTRQPSAKVAELRKLRDPERKPLRWWFSDGRMALRNEAAALLAAKLAVMSEGARDAAAAVDGFRDAVEVSR